MSCHTNEKSIDLPSSINLLTPAEPLAEEDDLLREKACLASDDGDIDDETDESCKSGFTVNENRSLQAYHSNIPADILHHIPKLSIAMPSSQVVEISQTFYWPLYSKPIDWIYRDHVSDACDLAEFQRRLRVVAEELHSLEFFQSPGVVSGIDAGGSETLIDDASAAEEQSDALRAGATIQKIVFELQQEKEDWFSDLSGGQKSKVELVRTVFLRESCPDVLLVDETMAPLDPASKELVMAKLKLFCQDSIIIVIYHTDVGQGKEIDGQIIDCVPSNNFFNRNIHLEKGIVHLRETC
jgi:hypothetical protein